MDAYFYYLVCFILFVVLFYKPIAKALVSFLDAKIIQIKWDIDSSLATRKDLLQELKELESSMKYTDQKHKEMLDMAKGEIEESYQAAVKDFDLALDYSKKNAEERVLQMKKETLAQMKAELLTKSLDIVSKYFADQKESSLDIAIISSLIV